MGKEGAKAFLRQRGIPREEIDEVMTDYEELDLASRLIQKKMKGIGQHQRRLISLLKRRGYSSQSIRKALKLNEEEI